MDNQEMHQEIDLIALLRAVLRRWWLILILAMIAGSGAYYVTMTYITPMYVARTTLFIGQDSSSLASVDLGVINLDNQLISDYRELIKTRLVTEQVIADLGLIATRESLVSNLGVSVIDKSRFMYVSFMDPVPERATIVVNQLAEVLAEQATEIVGVKNIQIVDFAVVPRYPISPNPLRNAMIAGVIGGLIALLLVFVEVMLLDNKVKTEEELEELLKLPSLGTIPIFKGEDRNNDKIIKKNRKKPV